MPDYSPTAWINAGAPAINATNLNKLENAVDAVEQAQRERPLKEVRAATTANITLSGTQTVDAIALAVGNSVLVKNQTTASQNGLYLVSLGSWTRTDDADAAVEFQGGTLISVQEGTANGGGLFICTNTTSVTIGTTALTFGRLNTDTSSLYKTDNTTPLKYSAFLTAASGNHQNAFQNAITALFSASGNYRYGLDLEGALITLVSPVQITIGQSNAERFMYNGKIQADPAFSGGTHLLSGVGVTGGHEFYIDKVDFHGAGVASWIAYDRGNWTISNCFFSNSKPGTTGPVVLGPPGINVTGTASPGLMMHLCRMTAPDAAVQPTSRTRVAIRSEAGDQKFIGCVAQYFRHAIIYDSFTCMIDSCHFFQGIPGQGTDYANHTALIKFTNGYGNFVLTNFYCDKGFIEVNNETNSTTAKLGGLTWTGGMTIGQNGESGFGWVVMKDHQNKTTLSIEDVSLSGIRFNNAGATQTAPTKLDAVIVGAEAAIDHFTPSSNQGVVMSNNTFNNQVDFQANPCTQEQVFASLTQHTFTFTGMFPFQGKPKRVLATQGEATSGGGQVLFVGNISGNNRTVRIDTAAVWAGTMAVTVTANLAQSSGVVDG